MRFLDPQCLICQDGGLKIQKFSKLQRRDVADLERQILDLIAKL